MFLCFWMWSEAVKFEIIQIKPKHTCIVCFYENITNYKYISIAFAIIIWVALQEHWKFNKLPNYISLTTQRCNECLRFSMWPQNVNLCTVTIFYLQYLKLQKSRCIVLSLNVITVFNPLKPELNPICYFWHY